VNDQLKPVVSEWHDDVEHRYTLEISGLNEDQFNSISRSVTDAMRNRTGGIIVTFCRNAVGIAVCSVLVAGAIWTTAAILSNLPGR
jgi:hypothetical protein